MISLIMQIKFIMMKLHQQLMICIMVILVQKGLREMIVEILFQHSIWKLMGSIFMKQKGLGEVLDAIQIEPH